MTMVVTTKDQSLHHARLLRSVNAPIVEVDSEFRVAFQTKSSLRFELGRSLLEQLPESSRESAWCALLQTLADGSPSTFSMRVGARHYRTEVTRVEGEERPSLCLLSHDVSEEVQARLQRERERQRLQVALEASQVGLWTWNLKSATVIWDRRMKEITGHEVPQSLEKWPELFAHPQDVELFSELAAAARLPGPLPSKPLRIVRADGQVRWILTFGRVLPDSEGRLETVVGGTLDITEQQILADRLRVAQRMEALGHLTAGVAHNFNNMLMVIGPCLAQIQAQCAPELQEDVEDALNAAARAADVVRDLMTFAGQQTRSQKELVEAALVCQRIVRLCGRSFPEEVTVTTRLESTARVECVPGALEQVLSNVLMNARDAVLSPRVQHPHVDLLVQDVERFGDAWVEVIISDNGPGIPPEVRERIFEPFVTTKPGGTGLGLASSQALIEQHGGQLACRSLSGGGTQFLILLPARGAGVSTPPARLASQAIQVQGGRILVVDDEPAIRRVVRRGLRRAGFDVDVAEDGTSVRRLIADQTYDLVLLDRTLREGKGAELVPELRRALPRAIILYFTGEPVDAAAKNEVDGLVQKPVNLAELVDHLHQVLSDRVPDSVRKASNE